MNNIDNNEFLPLNKNKLLNELIRLGVPDATILKIRWSSCIEDGYCTFTEKKKKKICFTKTHKKNNLCSIHKNKNINQEIDKIENMLENMNIDSIENDIFYNSMDVDNLTDTMCNTEASDTKYFEKETVSCFHLSEKNIDRLYEMSGILSKEIENYKIKKNKKINDLNILYKTIYNYNNTLYEMDKEPHISISFLLQFFEELYETSNEFFGKIMTNYGDIDLFLEICKKWKNEIKEMTEEIIRLPDYYNEYFTIINTYIDNKLLYNL